MSRKPFHFKQFDIYHDQCAFKVGTDGVLLGAWTDIEGASRALDIGTGSGLIAIMLAQRHLALHMDAVEIDEASFLQAQQNMQACRWSNRLQIFHQSLQDFAKDTTQQYDLIVSNPPYFNTGTTKQNQAKKNARHTATLPYQDLLKAVKKMLTNEGRFCLILPTIEGQIFQKQAEKYGLFCTQLVEVHPKHDKGVERLLMQFEQIEKPPIISRLVIQFEQRNDYTPAYIELTKDFYTIM